jgi:hypothetical protein
MRESKSAGEWKCAGGYTVGEKNTSAFLSEVAAPDVRRRRLLEILNRDAPAWDPADHPDIEQAGGAAAWVRKLRREADKASWGRLRTKRGREIKKPRRREV